jgi:serine/threonine protein kinase/tetratricopeptide (TPR) repeat protein
VIEQTVSHYRIIRELGAGGMGEVYLAEDLRLGRSVALKFLPASYQYDPDRRTRFMQEARATSALRSPHIVAIYDIGEYEGAIFIVMEYVEGELLSLRLERGPMPLRDVMMISAQIADALNEAHGFGIIHCDIKSANLILNERGAIKILDFGIAKVTRSGALRTDETTKELVRQTALNVVAGTVAYMSPEQAMGHPIDHRSDIFSLGVVMYEMITGHLPFGGANSIEVVDRIIHAEPVPIARLNYNVPPAFEHVVRKCLEKQPERRYQSSQELLVDLQNLLRDMDSGSRPPQGTTFDLHRPTQTLPRPPSRRRAIDSLAILPLINLSGDSETDYLSEGITESLIHTLSALPRLRVMARSTVFRYKVRTTGSLHAQEPDPMRVGRELNVRAVLVGRILQRGEQIIVKSELIDTLDGSHLWGGQISHSLCDICDIEEEMAAEIAEHLRLKLTGAQKKRLARRYTEDTAAYQLYLKGRYHWNRRTEEDLRRGIEFFEQAIALDPNYALAYSGLSDSHTLMASYSKMPPRTAFLRAKATAMKALKLDPKLAEARVSLAHIRFWYEWEWAAAEQEFKQAITLNPAYGTAHLWYALFLAAMRRGDEAVAEVRRALELEPLSPVVNLNVARIYYFSRRYDEAIDQCRKTMEMATDYPLAHRRLGMIYEQKQMYSEAVAEFERALQLVPHDTETMSALGHAYAAWGRTTDAEMSLVTLNELSSRLYVSPYSMARAYFGVGDRDRGFEQLEKTYRERHGILVYINVEPVFDDVRDDPRFEDLLRRMGLA